VAKFKACYTRPIWSMSMHRQSAAQQMSKDAITRMACLGFRLDQEAVILAPLEELFQPAKPRQMTPAPQLNR